MRERINQSLVDDTWRRIRAYDTTAAVAEAQRFAREQPAVLHLTREFLREFDEETQGAALGLVYLLFRTVEATRTYPVPSLSPEQIEDRYEQNTAWLDVLERMEFASLEEWQDHLPQSPVARYIVQTYAPPLQTPEPRERRRQGHLVVLLVTMLDALDAAEGNRESL